MGRWCFGQSNWKTAGLFGLFFAWNSLNCYYYALFGSVLVALYLIFAATLLGRQFPWRKVGQLATMLAASAVIHAPLVPPYFYWARQQGASRSVALAAYYSARPGDYFVPPRTSMWYTPPTESWRTSRGQERWLFPGVVLYMLGLAGLWTPTSDPLRQKQKWVFVGLAAACVVLSLGPRVTLTSGQTLPLPYALLYELVPGFQSLRVVARFAMWAFLAMAALAGLGAAGIIHLARRRFGNGPMIGACLIVLAIGDLWPSRHTYQFVRVPVGQEVPRVCRWLADHEATAVACLPMGTWSHPHLWAPLYMYYSIYHKKAILNGYSSFAPRDYSRWSVPGDYFRVSRVADRFPEPASVELLRKLQVDTVLVFQDAGSIPLEGFREGRARKIREQAQKLPGVHYVGNIDGVDIYRLQGPR